jgi:hypothetical protein
MTERKVDISKKIDSQQAGRQAKIHERLEVDSAGGLAMRR